MDKLTIQPPKQEVSEWFGDIPCHWEKKRIKYLFHLRDERNYKSLDQVNLISLYTKLGVVQNSDLEHTTGNKAANAEGYKCVYENDIVVNIILCWMGAVGRSAYNGVTSPAYDVYCPEKDVSSQYYHYLFRTSHFAQQCYKVGKGIMAMRWRTYSPQFKSIVVPVPPYEEQCKIVHYLDWQVSRINRLAAAKRREIELLKERITKLFEEAADLSTEKTRLHRIAVIVSDPVEVEDGAYYQKTGMYNRGRGIFQREPLLGADMGESSFQKVYKDCVMLSGQFAWEGAAYVTQEKDEIGVASHRYYLLKPDTEKVTSEYIWAYLMSRRGLMDMQLCSHGAAGRNRPLNIKELLNVYIPLPCSEEVLNEITEAVRTLFAFQSVASEHTRIISELKELIVYQAVTGKVDVRDIEIPEYTYLEDDSLSDLDEEDDEGQESEEQED